MTGDIPLYMQVADQLEAEIISLPAGDPMPSEHELADHHDINRLTARAALEELERRYLVRRQQGRRTIVARRIDFALDSKGVPGWTKTVRRSGGAPRTEVDIIREVTAPADIRDALKLPKKAKVVHLGRRRFVDDELAAYSESWLAADLVPKLEDRLGKTGTLNAALARYDHKTKRGLLHCSLNIATPEVAAYLDSPDRPLVFTLRTHLRTAKRELAITTTWLRADIFNVIYEMKSPA